MRSYIPVKARKRRFAAMSFAVLSLALVVANNPAEAAKQDRGLTRYEALEPNVEFWKDVFVLYTSRQAVFHDRDHVKLVYSIVDLGDIIDGDLSAYTQDRRIRERLRAETRRLEGILRHLAKGAPRNDEEKRISALVKDVLGSTTDAARLAINMRYQRGLGDEFCGAMSRASVLMPRMREMLEAEGVPVELAALPLVESSYRIDAHSYAGAVGMWQFTRSTGKRFMNVDYVYDERRDPLRATEAAAKYLRENYEKLGAWPLAITAYNYGAGGLVRAVQEHGTTDLSVILRKHKSRRFGFASRNFYAEFLAAKDVVAEAEKHCGKIEPAGPALASVRLRNYVAFDNIASAAGVKRDELAVWNPALHRDVVKGKLLVPRGYSVNVPTQAKQKLESGLAALPKSAWRSAQVAYYATHRVTRGQTLSHIAKIYATSVSSLKEYNNISDPRRLRYGQVIKVPTAGARLASTGTHRVTRGQTLSHIARLYDTSVSALKRTNGISDPRRLKYGQIIKVPR